MRGNISNKLYNVVRQEKAIVNMTGFGGIVRNKSRGVEPISVQKVENEIDEIT